MTRNEAKQKLLEQYKLEYNMYRMPICHSLEGLDSTDNPKPYDIYIPIEVVLDVIMEVANSK